MNQDKNTAGSSGDTFSKDNLKSEMAAGKGKLSELADSAASAGKAQLDSGLGQAAGQVEGVAKVIDETADRLRKDSHDGLASYATQIAGSIESVADRLRNSSVDELATEARQLARSNPALFLLGSVAVGFGLTRFLKASSRISHDYDDTGRMRQDVYGSTYGDTRDPTHDWDSGTGGRSQGGWDAGSRSSSGAAGSNWDRSGTAGAGASSGAGSSGSLGGSSGAGRSAGSSGGLGGSTGGLGSSTGGTGSGSFGTSPGSSGVSGKDTRTGSDPFDEARSRPVFPEMNTAGLSSGGTVGGTRTNEVGGGSHG